MKYNKDSIVVLPALEAVVKRPGMYIGNTEKEGLHHLLWEILANATDEVLSGHANSIRVTLKKDNSVVIYDDGRGIPYKKHKTGPSTIEVIFTVLHSGSKFNNQSYQFSGGLHGVGAAVVNALSNFVEVTVFESKKKHQQLFEEGGKKIHSLTSSTNDSLYKKGTQIHFLPNYQLFSYKEIDEVVVKEKLEELSFLIPKLKIFFSNEKKQEKQTFFCEKGLIAFLNKIIQEEEKLHSPFFISEKINYKNNLFMIDLIFQYTDKNEEQIISFVNNIKTSEGGSHENAVKKTFTKIFNKYIKKLKLEKKIPKELNGEDFRQGLNLILSVKVPESFLKFEGQTKQKLASNETKIAIEQFLIPKLDLFFAKHITLIKKIINKSIFIAKNREKLKEEKDFFKQQKQNKKKNVLAGKLASAQVTNNQISELFLVEGNSAGGSAKQARNKLFQAILPLRGKVLNVAKNNLMNILKNAEINDILHAIGVDLQKKNQNTINYNKIIIMTDADDDGAHIQILLLTFFFYYMKNIILEKKLFIAQPPLYKISYNKQEFYAWSETEMKKIIAHKSKYSIQRYKGLGEMNYQQLWDTTMNPATRNLIQVNIEDLEEAQNYVSLFMSDEAISRRNWIEKNVNFHSEDIIKKQDK